MCAESHDSRIQITGIGDLAGRRRPGIVEKWQDIFLREAVTPVIAGEGPHRWRWGNFSTGVDADFRFPIVIAVLSFFLPVWNSD
jgi:hypothetical protein